MGDELSLNLVINSATLLGVLGLAVRVWLAGRKQRIEQPLEIRAAFSATPQAQCNERHAALDSQVGNLFARMARSERADAAAEARRQDIDKRLDAMDSKLDILLKRR